MGLFALVRTIKVPTERDDCAVANASAAFGPHIEDSAPGDAGRAAANMITRSREDAKVVG